MRLLPFELFFLTLGMRGDTLIAAGEIDADLLQ